MASVTVVKTIGFVIPGVFSDPQLWEDGAPADETTAEKSAAGTFATAAFVQGEALTFVGSGATGKLLDTDSTGPGTGTYVTYGITSGNPAAGDVVTGGASLGTCILSSSTPLNVGVVWQGQCENEKFVVIGAPVLTISGSTSSSTAYKEITTVAGASFRDNANVQTNALRWVETNGCAFGSVFADCLVSAEANARGSNIQLSSDDAGGLGVTSASTDALFDFLIVEGLYTGTDAALGAAYLLSNAKLRNSLVIQNASAADHIIGTGTGSPSLYNTAVVAWDDLASAPTSIFKSGASGTVTVQNCGLFAGDTTKAIKTGSATFNFTTCYSDISGTGGVTQAYFKSEFQDVNISTGDFRPLTGTDQEDAGTTDSTNAAFDIAGTARPESAAYDVGCWELLATTPVIPTVRSVGPVASGTGAITPTMAPIVETGDDLYLIIESAIMNGAVSGGSETWVQMPDSPQSVGSGTTLSRISCYWARASSASPTSPTVAAASNHQQGCIIAVKNGAGTGDPWDVTAGGTEVGPDTSLSIPGDTTTMANCLILLLAATSLPDAATTTEFGAMTNAGLTNLTEHVDNTIIAGNGGGLFVGTGMKAAAGAYAATTLTAVTSASHAMMSIALKPPQAGGQPSVRRWGGIPGRERVLPRFSQLW